MAKVSIRHVCKTFPAGTADVPAIRDLSLEVANGEFLVLVGPSGCGKSTLLRLIAGLESPDAGEIFIGDKCVNGVAPSQRDISLVFQSHALFPHLNVFDNIAFGLKLRRHPPAEIKKRVAEAAAILDIEMLLARRPAQLSGGQSQRVALGRAMVRQPRVFLFDEPLSNLDARTRAQMRTELSRLHERLQTTMIYVTHDQVEAMSMGDNIAVMDRGTLPQVGRPAEIYQQPRNTFVAGFFGQPPMNLIPGKLSAIEDRFLFKEDAGGVIECSFVQHDRPALKAFVGREVILGIRPEDIERVAAGEPGRKRGENNFQCLLDLVEPTGGETNLHLQTGRGLIICRARTILDQREAGHRAQFQINVGNVALFDAVSTDRIA